MSEQTFQEQNQPTSPAAPIRLPFPRIPAHLLNLTIAVAGSNAVLRSATRTLGSAIVNEKSPANKTNEAINAHKDSSRTMAEKNL